MLKTDGTFNKEGSASLSLVTAIRQLNIEVPAAVDAEVQLYRDLPKARETAQSDYAAAVSRLRSVEPDQFDAAKAAVVDASTTVFALMQGVDNVLIDAAARRLTDRVYDAAPGWESAVVERFNEAVDYYELNKLAGDLPDFSDPKSFNVLSLGKKQGHAIERWRTAADLLKPLWSAYQKLATFNGHLLGPADSSDVAVNLFTACALGDPGSFGRAGAAATKLATIAFGADSVRPYAQINPFVVPPLMGYHLHLHTLEEAGVIRRRVQGI